MKTVMMLLCVAVLSAAPAVADEATKPDKRDDDRKAITAMVESYVAAFNRGDAKALAAHWSPTGQYISRNTGERISGRDALEKDFAALFADDKSSRLEVTLESLRFLSADVAIEEGSATIAHRGELPTKTSYTAIHVKKDGKWLIDTTRETVLPAVSSNYDKLKELEWMIGTWVDKDENATVETTCNWTKNRNFLLRQFKISVKDRIEMEGTQIIGYDAAAGRIRSWVFDSDGGIGEGIWTREGNRWIVKASGTQAGGQRTSAVHIITYGDANSFTWQSVGREVDGELLPNIDEFQIVKK